MLDHAYDPTEPPVTDNVADWPVHKVGVFDTEIKVGVASAKILIDADAEPQAFVTPTVYKPVALTTIVFVLGEPPVHK